MEENGVIEAAPDGSSDEFDVLDVSSDYDPSLSESMFRSVTTTINEHVYEYGRRYHTYVQGRYPLPNDELESDRESLKHVLLKEIVGGKLHIAPVGDNLQKILDLGTGFGDWAIEAAEIYPSAHVIGIDLSPIQPKWVPPNLRFIVDDVEDEASWIHGNDIDFVHLRFLLNFVRDVPDLVSNIFTHLKPGGFVEIQDLCYKVGCDDSTLPADYPLLKFMEIIKRVLQEKYKFDITFVEFMPELLANKGFVNITQKTFKLPIGEWPKDPDLKTIGRYWRPSLVDFFAAMASKPMIEAELDRSEIDQLLQQCNEAMANRRIHAYMVLHFVWAQKPDPQAPSG